MHNSAFCFRLGVFLLLLPQESSAQQNEMQQRRILALSPLETFYKLQLGYEQLLSARWSAGLNATYYPGWQPRFQGWQTTSFIRFSPRHTFPTGFYLQGQASIFNHPLYVRLSDKTTRQSTQLAYWGVRGGAGLGAGYRCYLLARPLQHHLLLNLMSGLRLQARPAYSYDQTRYYKTPTLLDEKFNWHVGPGPATVPFGLVTLEYAF